jgi:oligoribonuclease NrnB/cAMP/cGMP phosphodiesterase (DHH superfamily)
MYKLITHNDLDGLGCAILAKLAFKNDIEIEYCSSPNDVAEKLFYAYEYKKIYNYNKVYITDCSIPSDKKELFALIEKHKNVSLFDHHKTAVGLNEFPWAKVSVENEKGNLTCGTELWHDFLIKKGMITPRPYFVEQVRLYDTWDWSKQNSQLPKYLNDVVYILGISNFVDTFTDRLKKTDINELTIFNQSERELLNHEQDTINKFVENKTKSAKRIVVNNQSIAVSFADRYQSVLGNKLCHMNNDSDMAIMFNLDDGFVSLRSSGIDTTPFAIAFNGGGHQQASGGRISEEVRNKIIELLFKNIGTVESIEDLKED